MAQNFVQYIQFCRARRALSNHAKYISDIIDTLSCKGGEKGFVTPCIQFYGGDPFLLKMEQFPD